jgi:hypothetical protein
MVKAACEPLARGLKNARQGRMMKAAARPN